jgi:hypothetical protein
MLENPFGLLVEALTYGMKQDFERSLKTKPIGYNCYGCGKRFEVNPALGMPKVAGIRQSDGTIVGEVFCSDECQEGYMQKQGLTKEVR